MFNEYKSSLVPTGLSSTATQGHIGFPPPTNHNNLLTFARQMNRGRPTGGWKMGWMCWQTSSLSKQTLINVATVRNYPEGSVVFCSR